MNAGAFAVLSLIVDENDHGDDIEFLEGFGRSHPMLAAALSIFLFSLAGFPLFAGFIGKIFVFQAALAQGYNVLAVIGIVSSLVAVVYYMRPVIAMYFKSGDHNLRVSASVPTMIAISFAAVLTILMGILPGWWYGLFEIGQRLVAGG